jgi:hypothetical protein
MPRNFRIGFFLDPTRNKPHEMGNYWMRTSELKLDKKEMLLTWHDRFVQELKSNPSDVFAREDLEAICTMVPQELKLWRLRTTQWNERPQDTNWLSYRNMPASDPPFSNEIAEQILSTTLKTLDSKDLFRAAFESFPEHPSPQTLINTGVAWIRYDLSLSDLYVSSRSYRYIAGVLWRYF